MSDQASGEELPPEPGDPAAVVEGGDGSLLDLLLYKGVLPRYAFPTDVASFHVFDASHTVPTRPKFIHSPGQGLSVALSQYAPGKEVWIASQRYVSGAVYSQSWEERSDAWQKRRLYLECTNCGYAATRDLTEGDRGVSETCLACGVSNALGPSRYWMRPPGFAHPIDAVPGTSTDEVAIQSYPTGAKLEAPSPALDDRRWEIVTDAIRLLAMREPLLVTNTGPRGEGYNYCVSCGRIEPSAITTSLVLSQHTKPYPDGRSQACTASRVTRGVCLGTDYITDVLLFEFTVSDPVRLPPGVLATEVALRTTSEALAKAACLALELEQGEVMAEFRPAVSADGPTGRCVEIYVYDSLAGGAGFSTEVGRRARDVLTLALELLQSCDCDQSCYKCLRSFRNRRDHEVLDRHVGKSFLELLLYGREPSLTTKRSDTIVDIIEQDLLRQVGDQVSTSRNTVVDIPDVGSVAVPLLVTTKRGARLGIVVTHCLTPTKPSTPQLADVVECSTELPLRCYNELLARRALPSVTRDIVEALGIDAS